MPSRLVYVLHHAITNGSDGYAIRGHAIARTLQQAGVNVKVMVMPTDHDRALPLHQQLDSVDYFHCGNFSGYSLEQLLALLKPNAVLAASNWQNALPAQQAAAILNIPFWYEVRGFWELSQCTWDPDFQNSTAFHESVEAETEICQAAERVFTLNRQMSTELVRRGVNGSRIALVPNGIEAIETIETTASEELIERFGLGASKVIGYLGSFNHYEGLCDLVTALARVVNAGLNAKLLLVGSLVPMGTADVACEARSALLDHAHRLGVADRVVLSGRVPPEQLPHLYALMDLVVIPRRPDPVCELVSPLKPLEAACFGVPLLLSTVAPLADLHSLGPGVHLFEKGSIHALTSALEAILPTAHRAEPRRLFPELERCLWSNNVAPILKALAQTPMYWRRQQPRLSRENRQPSQS